MAFSEFGEPGAGSSDLGYTFTFQFPNGKLIQGFAQISDTTTDADIQKVVDAVAGIPGCVRADVTHGKVAQRVMTPEREYEPLPPPPLD